MNKAYVNIVAEQGITEFDLSASVNKRPNIKGEELYVLMDHKWILLLTRVAKIVFLHLFLTSF